MAVIPTLAEKPLAPGLYLVATPIGNLEDITLRALRVLGQADRIACEDTRQTQKLLNHFDIRTPTVSYHLFNESDRSEELVTQLRSGARIAVVSDAGTPGIADPGSYLVAAAIAAGIPVFPIPGANAALSALVASGLPAVSFTFHGFLPSKAGARRNLLEALPRDSATHIFYESPHRILETLADLAAIFPPSHPIVLARELTKLHEEFLRAPIAQLQTTLTARHLQAGLIRGEFVLLFTLPEANADPAHLSVAAAVDALMQKESLSEKEALKLVARERNISKSAAYRELQRTQTKNRS